MARAAPAIWPYPHRTVAEVFAIERRPTNLPLEPCVRCGARGWCGHAGRIAA